MFLIAVAPFLLCGSKKEKRDYRPIQARFVYAVLLQEALPTINSCIREHRFYITTNVVFIDRR